MTNIIVILVVAGCVGAALRYLVKAKKSGVKCIGCSSGGGCSGHCAGGCSCGTSAEDSKTP